MQQLRQPSSLEVSTVDAASQQLTDAQRAFADVVGRELARIWIDGPGRDTAHESSGRLSWGIS